MKKKLRSSKGMTLTELIMALAVVSLIGVSLTTGINGGVKVYRDATRLYEAETLCGTILTYLEDEFRFARNIQVDPTDAVPSDPADPSVLDNKKVTSFDSQYFGSDAKILWDTGRIQIETSAGNYKLLSDSAYTNGLKVSNCEVRYNDSAFTIKVAVGSDETSQYVEHDVRVSPLGG